MSTGHASVEEGKRKNVLTRAAHKVAKRTGFSDGRSIKPTIGGEPRASETRPDMQEAVESKESVPKKSSWLPSLRNPFMAKTTSMLDNVYDPSHADDLKHFTADFSEGERTAEEREAAGAPTWDNIAPKFREKPTAMPGGDSRAVRRGDWQKTRSGGFVPKEEGHDTAAQPYLRGEATPGGTAPLKEPTRRQDMIADLGHSMQQGRQKVGSVGGKAVKVATDATEKAHKAYDKTKEKFDKKMESGQEAMDDVEEKAETADAHLGKASDDIHGKTDMANRMGVDTSEIDHTVDSAHSTGSGVLSSISGAASQMGEHLDDIHGAVDDALDFIPGLSEAKSAYRIGKSGAIGMDLDSRITAHNLKQSEAATTAREGRQSARKLASGKGLAGLMKQKSAVTNEIATAGITDSETSSALQQGLKHVDTREAQPSLVAPATAEVSSVKSALPEKEITDVAGPRRTTLTGVNIGADFARVTANGGAKSAGAEVAGPRRDPMASNVDYRPDAVKALDHAPDVSWKPSSKLGGTWKPKQSYDPSTRFDDHSNFAGGASQVLNTVGHGAHDVGKAFTGKGHDAEIDKLAKSKNIKDLERARKLAALNVGAAGAKLGTSIAAPGASQALSLSAHVADKGGKMLADATQGRSDEQDVVDRVRHRESPEFLDEVAASKSKALADLPTGHAEMQDKLNKTGSAYDDMVASHEGRKAAEAKAEKKRPKGAKLGPWLPKEGMDRSAGSERSDLPHYLPESRPKSAAVDPEHVPMNKLFGERKEKSAAVDPEHHSMNKLFGSDRSPTDAVEPEHHSMNRLLGSGRTPTDAVGPEHVPMNKLFGEKKQKTASVGPEHEPMESMFREHPGFEAAQPTEEHNFQKALDPIANSGTRKGLGWYRKMKSAAGRASKSIRSGVASLKQRLGFGLGPIDKRDNEPHVGELPKKFDDGMNPSWHHPTRR